MDPRFARCFYSIYRLARPLLLGAHTPPPRFTVTSTGSSKVKNGQMLDVVGL